MGGVKAPKIAVDLFDIGAGYERSELLAIRGCDVAEWACVRRVTCPILQRLVSGNRGQLPLGLRGRGVLTAGDHHGACAIRFGFAILQPLGVIGWRRRPIFRRRKNHGVIDISRFL